MQAESKAPSKNRIAYERIKEMIVENRLQTGQIISENLLALELNMSRTPIREAIRILCKDGFLEIHNGVGIYVKHITVKEINDLNEVRVMLETMALTTAVNKIKADDIEKLLTEWYALRQKLQTQGGQADAQITAEIYRVDARTHLLIVDHADNEYVRELYEDVRLKVQRFQRMITNAFNDDLQTIDMHIQLLQYVQNKDIDRAVAMLRQYIFDSLQVTINNRQGNIPVF